MLYRLLKLTLAIVPAMMLALMPNISAGVEMPPGKWWRMPPVLERLELTDQEKKELDELFLESRRNLIDLKGVLEKEQLELENIIYVIGISICDMN